VTHRQKASKRGTLVNRQQSATAATARHESGELRTVAEVRQLVLSTFCRRRRRRKITTRRRRLSEQRENRSIWRAVGTWGIISDGAAQGRQRRRKLRPIGDNVDAARCMPGRPLPPHAATGPATFVAETELLSMTATAEMSGRGTRHSHQDARTGTRQQTHEVDAPRAD